MRPRRLLPLLFLSAFAPAVVAQTADLRVSLTMPPTSFYSLTWGTLTITNAGNVPAQDVTFDFGGGLGPSLPYQGVTCSGPLFTHCKVPTIVPGSVTVPIAANWYTLPPAGTVETTSVTASSATTPDPDFTNNTASANTTIVWQADLTFDSLNVASAVGPGESAGIRADFNNHGPSPATDLLLTISIPPGARYAGYLADWQFQCAEPPIGGHGDLVCTAPWNYDDGPDSIQAMVSVDPLLAAGTVLPLNATLTSTSALKSPLTASGSLEVAAPASPDANVSVTATFEKPSVLRNQAVWETVTISNAGPRAAEIVTLDVRPPVTATFVGNPSLGSCSGYAPIHCTMATLPAGGTMKLMVLSNISATGTFTSTAVATWLHGGTAVASNALIVNPPTPPRRRAARH